MGGKSAPVWMLLVLRKEELCARQRFLEGGANVFPADVIQEISALHRDQRLGVRAADDEMLAFLLQPSVQVLESV